MKVVITRVSQAQVHIRGSLFSQIGKGMLALVGVEKKDTQITTQDMLKRMMHYQIFADGDDRMRLNLQDVEGDLMLVPQFTLATGTQKGNKANFADAAPAEDAAKIFEYMTGLARSVYDDKKVHCGKFGAMMDVSSVNCGPVTFILTTQ